MLRLILATMHLVALGIGLGGVWARARALNESPLTLAAAKRAFAADTWWGIAAALWISTGLWRLFAGTEKATTYYLHNHVFYAKMGFLLLIMLLELWPMITLIRWRVDAGRKPDTWRPDSATADRIRIICSVQVALVIAMVAAAVTISRGYGN